MAKTPQQIVDDIKGYAGGFPGQFSGWYVGITDDPQECLFTRHGVDRENVPWIHRGAANITDARLAERSLILEGFDGGPGGGTDNSTVVYAYKKSPTTSED